MVSASQFSSNWPRGGRSDVFFFFLIHSDNDEIEDKFDNCLSQPNPDQQDTDGDGRGIGILSVSLNREKRFSWKENFPKISWFR